MKFATNLLGTFLFLSITISTAYAQPSNDACSGAFPVTPDGTCYGPGLPQTTTVGAGDHWVGTLGCAGNNDEVWFSFTATTSQLDISVTAGTMGGNIEFVLVQSLSPPCGGITLGGGGGTLCGASPLTGTFNGLQVGETYYYTISSTGSAGTFTTCVNNVVPTPVAGQDCAVAAILCDDAGFSQGTSAAGYGAQEVSTGNSCWGSGGERQSKWFKFTIGCSGTLEFNINPVTNSNDYDWALWDVTSDLTCSTKGNSIACDWSGCKGSTGMSSCPTSEPGVVTGGSGCFGGPAAWEAPITVTAGNTYALLVDNFSTSNDGFSLTFGGACNTGTAVIGPDADFTGSLDATCLVFTGIKTCPTSNSTYLWNYGDGATSTGMNGSHTYTVPGNYTVSLTVTDALGCTKTYSETVNVGCLPLPIELLDFSAELEGDHVNLDWTTLSETNNDYFTLERSADGYIFQTIGTVDAIGNSQSNHDYSFVDRSPNPDYSFYRLKQTDVDGNYKYSAVVSILNTEGNLSEASIFPNPTEGISYLQFRSAQKEALQVSIVDISGNVVATQHVTSRLGTNEIQLETASLQRGVYLVKVESLSETKTIRFTKQ